VLGLESFLKVVIFPLMLFAWSA